MTPFNLHHMTAAAEIRLANFIDGMVQAHKAEMRKRTGQLVIDFGSVIPLMNLKITPLGVYPLGGAMIVKNLRMDSRELHCNLPLGRYEIEARAPFFEWKKITVDTREKCHVRFDFTPHQFTEWMTQ